MTIIFQIVIYFQNIFVVSLIDSVVITKCYNSYLGYLTKISYLVQVFFLYMLCRLLIEGIEFLLRDSLLHAPFFVLHIKNVQENDHLQYFFSCQISPSMKIDEAHLLYMNKELPHLFSIVQIRGRVQFQRKKILRWNLANLKY